MLKKLKKQIGGSLKALGCPPGMICMSNSMWIFIFMFIVGVLLYLGSIIKNSKQDTIYKTIIREVLPLSQDRDSDLDPPEREYRGRYPGRSQGIPINVKTRGQDSYQQVGLLYKINDSTNRTVLPLYGRRVYLGSNMWNYYTTSDSHSIVKLPLHNNGNNCTSDRGCQEFMNGDTITINALGNGSFKVEIYEYDAPRYIPYL